MLAKEIKPGSTVEHEGSPVLIEVVECEPAARGNSATARSKPARLETGLIVQVPDYLKQGERIQVDTRTGEYLSRG